MNQLSLFAAPARLDPAEEAAKKLIAKYIAKGWRLPWLHGLGHSGDDYFGSVEGNRVIIEELNGQTIRKAFSLPKLAKVIRDEYECDPELPPYHGEYADSPSQNDE